MAAIYQLRQFSQAQDKKSFEDFLKRHLENSDEASSAGVQVAIPTSLTFAITLLKEVLIMNVGQDMIVSTLESTLQSISRVRPGALFQDYDRTSFILDASLNDARSFLIELISTSKNAKVQELSLKIILAMANMRKSVEDVLVVYDLLKSGLVLEADLREQMHPLIERGRASPDAAVDEKFEPEDPTQLED